MMPFFFVYTLQLDSLMVPAPGSEPLAFKSIFAASAGLQAKACIERAWKQVRIKAPCTKVKNAHICLGQGRCRAASCHAG